MFVGDFDVYKCSLATAAISFLLIYNIEDEPNLAKLLNTDEK